MGPFAPSQPKQAAAPAAKPRPKPRQTKPKQDRDKTADIEKERRRVTGGGRLSTVLGAASDSLGD
tara:strand:+ start:1347 stop:1541 length:195 start_codon:yes stop_codon:yes gene_type:complete